MWHSIALLAGVGGFEDNMHQAALQLVMQVQGEEWNRTQAPLSHGPWELVHSEAEEACEGWYDPCTIFVNKTQAQIGRAWRYRSPPWPPPGAPFAVNVPGWDGG